MAKKKITMTKDEILELIKQSNSFRQVADIAGVSYERIRQIAKTFNITGKKRKETKHNQFIKALNTDKRSINALSKEFGFSYGWATELNKKYRNSEKRENIVRTFKNRMVCHDLRKMDNLAINESVVVNHTSQKPCQNAHSRAGRLKIRIKTKKISPNQMEVTRIA